MYVHSKRTNHCEYLYRLKPSNLISAGHTPLTRLFQIYPKAVDAVRVRTVTVVPRIRFEDHVAKIIARFDDYICLKTYS